MTLRYVYGDGHTFIVVVPAGCWTLQGVADKLGLVRELGIVAVEVLSYDPLR